MTVDYEHQTGRVAWQRLVPLGDYRCAWTQEVRRDETLGARTSPARPPPAASSGTLGHPTIDRLHQLGLEHARLTMKSHGIDRRLTDVHRQVIEELVG